MRSLFLLLTFVLGLGHSWAAPPPEKPTQTLNGFVAFLNQSAELVLTRLNGLKAYHDEVRHYQRHPDRPLRLPSSGPLETYYYQKALAGTGLTAAEKKTPVAAAERLWQRLNQLDQTGKALETYVRLKDYERDSLSRSAALMAQLQTLTEQCGQDRDALARELAQLQNRYVPHQPTNPYLATQREMEQILHQQQRLLDSLFFVLTDDQPTAWPIERVQQSLLADEEALASFGKANAPLAYPASDMVGRFREALRAIQAVKRQAVNEYTFAARQSARYGNQVYLDLINHVNGDLIASHRAFVGYSESAQPLLNYPTYCLRFRINVQTDAPPTRTQPTPFTDKPAPPFTVQPATTPISPGTFRVLNAYVDVINESLRQLHQLQVVARDYQSSMTLYRDRPQRRADLTYSHDNYHVPTADYRLLIRNSQAIPEPYRTSLTTQAEVLLAMLTELDQLSIELTGYTTGKQYQQDRWQRADAILDRYAYLFERFDQRKETLYVDVRRVFERYRVAVPASPWNRSGKALLALLDHDKAALFGVRDFYSLRAAQLPPTAPIDSAARHLIANEYANLNNLTRLGRSNGLCPYSRYEDIAEASIQLAGQIRKARPLSARTGEHPYQSVYYGFNHLVDDYNRFTELAKEPLLKAVIQPDGFVFQRVAASDGVPPVPQRTQPADQPLLSRADKPAKQPGSAPQKTVAGRDTVYVERTRVDTVYVDRGRPAEVVPSLAGFAANNMVFLLDVSGSMDAPEKLPLLKRSIKSLLKLLRPEDQISVVVYSGKARVMLEPTSGKWASDIARVIDELESDGDTDGNKGLRLAYKIANKNYLRAGNNRIVLATDGEFPVSDETTQLISDFARQDIYLTVFTFGKNPIMGQRLKQLAERGKGTFAHVTPETASLQLILEAQAKKLPAR